MHLDPGLIATSIKLLLSLLGVLALGWLARWLELGGDMRIRDEDHAKQLAFEGLYGFKGVDAVLDLAGYSALVRDANNRHALMSVLGNRIVCRMLHLPIEGRLDQRLLTIDLQEPDFAPVTLNLGEQAPFWASGLRHIPHD
jgi:hypothetical protein